MGPITHTMYRLGHHRYIVAQLLPAAQPWRAFASAAPTSLFTSKMLDRFATMQQRHEELCLQLNKVGGADAAAMVELSELSPVVEALAELDGKGRGGAEPDGPSSASGPRCSVRCLVKTYSPC